MNADSEPVQDGGEPKARIFISYSRKDLAFTDHLEAALRARGFEPLIDRSEIYFFEDWWKRIEEIRLFSGQTTSKALGDVQITPSAFKALLPNSKKKAQICTTRYVSRLVAAGKATCTDLKTGDLFLPILLTDEEAEVVNDLVSGCLADLILKHKDKLLPGR